MNLKTTFAIVSLYIAFTGCSKQACELPGPRRAEFKYNTELKVGQVFLDNKKILELRTSSNAEYIVVYDEYNHGREIVTIGVSPGDVDMQRKVYDGKSMKIVKYKENGEVDVRAELKP